MSPSDELFAIAIRLEAVSQSADFEAAKEALNAMERAAREVNRASSGSWLGYHADVYYAGLQSPPPGAQFSQEWGLKELYGDLGSRGDWREFDPQKVRRSIENAADNPDLNIVEMAAEAAAEDFNVAKAEIRSILLTENSDGSDAFLKQLLADVDQLENLTPAQIVSDWSPKGRVITRDMIALNQQARVPVHRAIEAEVASIRQSFLVCGEAAKISRKAASHIERKAKRYVRDARIGTNVFIGHGRSLAWREMKDFVQDRLHLPWDEFNRVPVAGVTNQARLSEMLDAAAIALVIMTAEDETAEGKTHARMNVIHEVGLFQGRLGFTKAIVLLEEGCEEFSNIQGLGQIRFPAGNIKAVFEEVRLVLERESVISPP